MKKRILILGLVMNYFSSLGIIQNEKSYTQDSLLSIKLRKKGINQGRLGDFEEALSTFNQAYTIQKEMFGENSYRLTALLINMGIQYKNLGDIDKAIEVYQKAEKLFINEFGADHSSLGVVYVNLGNIYRRIGDYNQALKYQENACRVLSKDRIRFNTNYQDSKYNIAEIQLKLGHNDEVIQFALSNLKTTLPILKPRLYDLIALAYQNKKEYLFAEKYYLLSIKSWIDLYGEDSNELALEYLTYSSFLISQKKLEMARFYSSKAKHIVIKFYGEKSSAYADVESNLGDYYFSKNYEVQRIDEFRSQQKKDLSEAIQYYQNALVSLVDSFHIKDPFIDPPLKNIISEIQLIEAFKKKAIAMEKLADLYLSEFDYNNSFRYFSSSLNSLTKAISLIHRIQIGFKNEESKYFLTQNQESTFYEAIRISFKLYNQTKKKEYIDRAFEFSERSKSSNLLASVKEIKAKEFGGIPDSLLKRENYLKSNSATYASMLYEENHSEKPDPQKVNLYSDKIFKYDEEHSKLIDLFEKSYPSYYALKYENKICGISEIQSKLEARQSLIEFFVKEPEVNDPEGELYRFVITKDSVDFSMEKIDFSYVKNIQTIHDFLVNPNYLYTKKQDFQDYVISGFKLYKQLLMPIAKKIKGKDLTIIPHDKLSYIPFDALLSQMSDTSIMNFKNLKYLVHDYVINYSYSATLLYDYFEKKHRSTKGMLVFAPSYDPKSTYTDPETSTQRFLTPLPGSMDEVKAISKYIKIDSYTNDDAQESTFKEKATEYDILHLAMHTMINDSLSMFSKLVFSKPNNKSIDDGYLNTYEIYNLKLQARLAILSACETGTGKLQKGEGVMSMARGFIYSGCPSIVMTLWQVEDKSGVHIMDDFYSYLSKGKRKDVALQMAKLKHLKSSDPLTSHPHYWLGYMNIGNSLPLYTSKSIYFVSFIFIITLFLVGDWYLRKKRYRKLKKH